MAAIIGLVFVLPTFHFDIDYVQTSLLRESILAHRGNIFLIPPAFPGKNSTFPALVLICLFGSFFIIH